ncbi:MAG: sensor histidine kinase [Phocaeicola sp.]
MVENYDNGEASSEVLNAVLKNINAYVLLIDEDFKVLMTNYYDLTGTVASSAAQRVGDLLHCKNALNAEQGCGTHEGCSTCPIRAKITDTFEQKEDFSNFESFISIVKDDNNLVDCDVCISGKFLKLEENPLIVLTVYDVTQMKNIQKELQQARLDAEEANRSKSAFLANMNHEIRTPLNTILGFSELLATAETEEEKEQYLEIIRVNNELIQQLIGDILDLAKIEAGTLEFTYSDVDLNNLMFDVEQSMRMRLGDKIETIDLMRETPEDCHVLSSDQNRLMQVLSNFVTNAIKFTDKGTITMGYRLKGDDFYFYVKDTGNGISEEKLGSIFDRFTRIEKKKQGTGLGLAICKTIVDKLGGKIGVESKLSKGSTFWFTVPV